MGLVVDYERQGVDASIPVLSLTARGSGYLYVYILICFAWIIPC
jgi:hypothetical protein